MNSERVVVVGGGAVGLAVAGAIRRKRSVEVVLLERAKIGSGSSSQITGGFRNLFEDQALVKLSDLAFALLIRGREKELEWEEGGYSRVAASDAEAHRLQGMNETLREAGATVERLEPQDVRRMFPWIAADRLVCASWGPKGGIFASEAVRARLVGECTRHSVVLREGAEVTGLSIRGGAVKGVSIGDDVVEATTVVLAIAGWTPGFLERLGINIAITPTVGAVFRIPLPASVTLPSPLTTEDITNAAGTQMGVYFRPGRDGLVIGGLDSGRRPTLSPKLDLSDSATMVAEVQKWIPSVEVAPAQEGWTGIRDMSPDDRGFLGPIPNVSGLYVAAGFGSHGFMHAVAIGDLTADLIAGEAPAIDVEPFSPSRTFNGQNTA